MDDDHDREGLLDGPHPSATRHSRRHTSSGLASYLRAFQRPRRLRIILLPIIGVLLILILSHPSSRQYLPSSITSAFADQSHIDALGLPTLTWPLLPPSTSRFPKIFTRPTAPPVGSPEWSALFPKTLVHPPPEPHPSWLARYQAIEFAHPQLWAKIQSIPQATLNRQNGLAEYPGNFNFESDGICSFRRASCTRPYPWKIEGSNNTKIEGSDITHGQPSTWAVNFDDGPLPPSTNLYKFLSTQSSNFSRGPLTATHYWIGSHVVLYPELSLGAYNRNDSLQIHTWSHSHLTTLSSPEIISELGWTFAAISSLSASTTDPYIPKYFRPPYGDIDDRVRLIASLVFGLRAVMWNGDSSDWALDQKHATGDFVDPPYEGFLGNLGRCKGEIGNVISSDMNEGKIILEHELSELSVQAFMETFPEVVKKGWKVGTVEEVIDGLEK